MDFLALLRAELEQGEAPADDSVADEDHVGAVGSQDENHSGLVGSQDENHDSGLVGSQDENHSGLEGDSLQLIPYSGRSDEDSESSGSNVLARGAAASAPVRPHPPTVWADHTCSDDVRALVVGGASSSPGGMNSRELVGTSGGSNFADEVRALVVGGDSLSSARRPSWEAFGSSPAFELLPKPNEERLGSSPAFELLPNEESPQWGGSSPAFEHLGREESPQWGDFVFLSEDVGMRFLVVEKSS